MAISLEPTLCPVAENVLDKIRHKVMRTEDED
jgi:hypothetical protein